MGSGFFATLLTLLLLAAPAGAAEPERIGSFQSITGVAASAAEGGALYGVDNLLNQSVREYTKEGAFVRTFGWGIIPGAAAGSGDLTSGSTQVTNAATASGRFLVGDLITGAGIPAATSITGVGSSTLELSKPATATASGVALSVAAGPGNVPTNELQTVTIGGSPSGGSFTLTFIAPSPQTVANPQTTGPISYNATAAEVESALTARTNIGAGNVSVSGSAGGPWTVEFGGSRYPDANVRTLGASGAGLTPSGSVAIKTPRQGAGAVETCTTVCSVESTEEGQEYGQGSAPGQLRYADAVAIDNDSSSSSYGDVYVVDQRNLRVEKYGPTGEFQLMFGGEVDKGPHHPGNLCTAAYLAEGDTCGAGVPGTGPAHFYEGPGGHDYEAWSSESNNSIAVGPEGRVYVGDFGRIQEFEPSGAFAGEFKLPDAEPMFVSALALDSAGNLYERSINHGVNEVVTLQAPGVREYGPGPAHAFVQTFDAEEAGSKPTHLALDPAGDLLVSDPNGLVFSPYCSTSDKEICPEMTFRAFNPAGQLYAIFSSPQVRTFPNFREPTGLAFGNGRLYAAAGYDGYIASIAPPVPGPPQVRVGSERSEAIEPQTTTLRAVVNPGGFETTVRFQYVTQAHFEAEGFEHAEETPPVHLPALIQNDPVSAALSSLVPETAYRWRAVAANECHGAAPEPICVAEGERDQHGAEIPQSLTTLPPVAVHGFTTQLVGPEEVELKAELSPNNGSATDWKITLCADALCASPLGERQGTLHVLGNEFEQIAASFEHLTPNTEYHYRLEATNSYGIPVKSADQALTTELSSAEERTAEDCPENGTVHGEVKSTLREQNISTALPDCRAYEQVSPQSKEGYGVEGQLGLAPSGGRDAFEALGAFAGASALGSEPDQYVAHRTEAGWVTKPSLAYAAGPGWQLNGLVEYDAGLENWLFRLAPGFAAEAITPTSSASFYLGRADGSFAPASPTIATQSGAAEGGTGWPPVVAQSADLSRLFILTSRKLLPEDPLGDSGAATLNRIYEVQGAGGPSPSLRLAAEVPVALAGTPGTSQCRLDTEFALPFNSSSADGQTLFYNGYYGPPDLLPGQNCDANQDVVKGPNKSAAFACSLAAGPCVPGLPGYHEPTQLSTNATAQCAEASPCHTSPPADAHLLAASPDGRLAWFTTRRALIDSDTDDANDLYLAKLTSTGQLETLIQVSRGEAGAGLAQGNGAEVQGVLAVSPGSTRAYFVARGLLTEGENSLHQKPQQGADNLYAYDATTGTTRFVTELCSGSEESGAVKDPACDKSLQSGHADAALWAEGDNHPGPEAQTTPDGRFLLFDSVGRLTADDTDATGSVFRYDLESGQLIRVSLGRRGNDGNANDEAYEAKISPAHQGTSVGRSFTGSTLDLMAEDAGRAISADGSTVVFSTAAPLVSRDTNAVHAAHPSCQNVGSGPHGEHLIAEGCDVYEWEQAGHGSCPPAEAAGCISLISPGTDPHNVRQPVISSTGQDVTFLTVQGISAGDTDGVADVYDARVNGGFRFVPKHEICNGAETPEGCNRHASEERLQINPASEVNEHGPEPVNSPKRCRKGFVLRHGRCVRKHHRPKRRHRRTARANNGGAK